MRRQARQVPVEEANDAGGVRQVTGQRLDAGRLAGAVGSDEADQRSFVHGERHVVHGRDPTEGHA